MAATAARFGEDRVARVRRMNRESGVYWSMGKKRGGGPPVSGLAGCFCGEEKRFGEKRRWAASGLIGLSQLGQVHSYFFLSVCFILFYFYFLI